MKTIIALILVITNMQVSAKMQPFIVQNHINTKDSSTSMVPPSMMQGFTVITLQEQTVLNWSINQNESARIFEVQKSSNGTDFKVVGIVMTSERSGEERYEFKERSGKGNQYYRIRLVNSDQQELFSEVKNAHIVSEMVARATRK